MISQRRDRKANPCRPFQTCWGLCLALADWSAELKLSLEEQHRQMKPPRPGPGGEREPMCRRLGFDRVGPLSVLRFGGNYRQAHFLAQRAADESTDRVRLPSGRLHEFQ